MLIATLLCALLFFNGCTHRKLTLAPLQEECSTILAKYLPKFDLPNSIAVYANTLCPKGCNAASVGRAFFFGLWKSYHIELESEEKFFALSPDIKEFILCHELAHIKLKHLHSHFTWQKPSIDLTLAHAHEYAADELAVQVIGHSRGAIKLFLGELFVLWSHLLLIMFPFFATYYLIARKKRFRRVALLWLLVALITCICIDMIEACISTHPALIKRTYYALRAAWN